MYFCRHRTNGNTVLNVYRRPDTPAYHGRCWWKKGLIVLNKNANDHTLAHEVAHMAYHSHGKRHLELTEKIFQFFEGGK